MVDHLIVYPYFNRYCVRSLKQLQEGTQLLNEYNCLWLQVNPIVGHLNFLLYDWKREVNHPLIKTPLKKIHLIWYEILIFFGVENKFIPNAYIYKC